MATRPATDTGAREERRVAVAEAWYAPISRRSRGVTGANSDERRRPPSLPSALRKVRQHEAQNRKDLRAQAVDTPSPASYAASYSAFVAVRRRRQLGRAARSVVVRSRTDAARKRWAGVALTGGFNPPESPAISGGSAGAYAASTPRAVRGAGALLDVAWRPFEVRSKSDGTSDDGSGSGSRRSRLFSVAELGSGSGCGSSSDCDRAAGTARQNALTAFPAATASERAAGITFARRLDAAVSGALYGVPPWAWTFMTILDGPRKTADVSAGGVERARARVVPRGVADRGPVE